MTFLFNFFFPINSTEDFKTSKHLETDVSLNGQQSLQTLPHSDLK